ncbi:competence type IV pilus assembly protein ComGB [Sediminibacillus albus]|nr:competence type IV pilus assembly protein ComGB [Sediminibacillus albus]
MDIQASRKLLPRSLLHPKLKSGDQLLFLKRLGRLITSGYPLMEALAMIGWDPRLSDTAAEISDSLYHGQPIDRAFEKARFSQNITSYLYFARSNGDLESTINLCSEMIERQLSQLHQFQKTIRYPLLLIGLFTVLLYFVKNSVYPAFIQIITSSGEAPVITSLSILIIDILFNSMIVFFLGCLIAIPVWLAARQHIPIDRQIKWCSRVPVISSYLRLKTTFLFALHLGSLLKTSIPIKDAFQILNHQQRLPILSFYAGRIASNLENGRHITGILPSLILFEQELTGIFQKNINAKELERDLHIYADFLTDRMQEKINKVIALIQPIVFCLLAGLIIFVYLSIMLPMFQLIKTI